MKIETQRAPKINEKTYPLCRTYSLTPRRLPQLPDQPIHHHSPHLNEPPTYHAVHGNSRFSCAYDHQRTRTFLNPPSSYSASYRNSYPTLNPHSENFSRSSTRAGRNAEQNQGSRFDNLQETGHHSYPTRNYRRNLEREPSLNLGNRFQVKEEIENQERLVIQLELKPVKRSTQLKEKIIGLMFCSSFTDSKKLRKLQKRQKFSSEEKYIGGI